MKKFISFLILLCLLLSSCGNIPDAAVPDEPQNNIDTPAAIPADTPDSNKQVQTHTQKPMIAVSLPAVNNNLTDAEGNTVYQHTYQNMYLTVQDPEVADKIILDFLRRIDQTHDQADDLYQQAKESGATLAAPYLFSILYNPTRIDQSVMSLFGSQVSYSGGIHPDYNCTAANYDMVTGDVLTLGSILYNVDAIDPLYKLVIDHLQDIEDSNFLYSDYPVIVKQRLFGDESYYEDFYFSSTGLCFFFPPYEIAPYASGTVTIEIPYAKLIGIIGDGFFPPETDTASGSVSAIRYQDTDLEQFTQIAEVIIDQDGEMLFLYTEGSVYDIKLDVGHWNAEGTVFTPGYTAFAAQSLMQSDAIMVQTSIPGILPVLRLSYKSGDERITVYIHQSSEDGSIILTNE